MIQGPPKDIFQVEHCKGLEVPFPGLGTKAKLPFHKVNPLVYTVLHVFGILTLALSLFYFSVFRLLLICIIYCKQPRFPKIKVINDLCASFQCFASQQQIHPLLPCFVIRVRSCKHSSHQLAWCETLLARDAGGTVQRKGLLLLTLLSSSFLAAAVLSACRVPSGVYLPGIFTDTVAIFLGSSAQFQQV